MAYFSQQEISSIKNNLNQPAPTKTTGRGGFLTSLISEGGATAGAGTGAAIGSLAGPVGSLVGAGLGGLIGGFTGRLAENKVRDNEWRPGQALEEGLISGIAGAGPGRLIKAGKGAVEGLAKKGTSDLAERTVLSEPVQQVAKPLDRAVQGANTALESTTPGFMSNMVGKTGRRLTEAGSGLKADTMPGGVARLEDNAQFMSKYTGTPRQQRVKMEADMKNLSGQVDDILSKTKTPIVGQNMSAELQKAIDDPNVFPELDLTQPRTTTLIQKNMKILADKTDAKDLNDFVKTLNSTASAARDKLASGTGRALTPNETAALATKRVIDGELTKIPEIAPLKQQMAQIFDVTPQVAKAAEQGISSPLFGGIKFKAPVQAVKGAQSKTGAVLQGASNLPPVNNYATRILASKAIPTGGGEGEQTQQQGDQNTNTDGQQAQAITAQDILDQQGSATGSTSPFSPENIQESVKNILAQGGTQKDVTEFLSNAKLMNDLAGAGQGAKKPLSTAAADAIANAQAGLTSLDQIRQELASNPGVQGKEAITQTFNPFGITGKLTGTSNYDTAITQAKDVIARLRTGAAISKSEEARFTKMLPQPADPPDTVNRKLDLLQNALQTVVGRVGGTSEAQDTLANAGL